MDLPPPALPRGWPIVPEPLWVRLLLHQGKGPSDRHESGRGTSRPVPGPPVDQDRRMWQRMKQIAFGKSTPGYIRYTLCVPHADRARLAALHAHDPGAYPVTPRVDLALSKRHWDAQLKQWRRDLHRWDEDGALSPAPVPDRSSALSEPPLPGAHRPYDTPSSAMDSA